MFQMFQGAAVNLGEGYTRASPLHLAVLKGDTDIIAMLLDAGVFFIYFLLTDLNCQAII